MGLRVRLENFIREIRRISGLEQIEFGRAMGMTGKDEAIQVTISKYENGKQVPLIETLEEMLRVIQLDLAFCLRLPDKDAERLEREVLNIFHSLNREEQGRVPTLFAGAFGARASPRVSKR